MGRHRLSRDARYEWWPAYQPDNFDVGDARILVRHLLSTAAFATLLCIPSVTRATGIGATSVIGMIGAHLLWYTLAALALAVRDPGPVRANLLMAGNLVVNTGVTVAIPVATHDPATPLWMLPVLYACMNGAMQERRPCFAFLLVHGLAPLVTLVFLLDGRERTDWSVAAPILCAVLSIVAYNHLAMMAAQWREVRTDQNDALSELRARIASRDRERLLHDLQASVGATLSVVASYGDLVERHLDEPDELRAVASMVREAARSGLGDLRGQLGAMAPAAANLDGVATILRQAAARASEGTTVAISVHTDGTAVPLGAAVRLAIVRVFQHSIRAALDRRETRRIEVRLASGQKSITLAIDDDGACARSDYSRVDSVDGGITELGGVLERLAAPGRGLNVRVTLPSATAGQ